MELHPGCCRSWRKPGDSAQVAGPLPGGSESALVDASSRPARSPRSIDPGKALLIVELRRRHMLQWQIARSAGVSESTVSRVLARAGLSKLSDLRPVEPVQLRARGCGRPAAHRHQEARPHRAPQPPRHRQPSRRRGGCWLGDAVRGD